MDAASLAWGVAWRFAALLVVTTLAGLGAVLASLGRPRERQGGLRGLARGLAGQLPGYALVSLSLALALTGLEGLGGAPLLWLAPAVLAVLVFNLFSLSFTLTVYALSSYSAWRLRVGRRPCPLYFRGGGLVRYSWELVGRQAAVLVGVAALATGIADYAYQPRPGSLLEALASPLALLAVGAVMVAAAARSLRGASRGEGTLWRALRAASGALAGEAALVAVAGLAGLAAAYLGYDTTTVVLAIALASIIPVLIAPLRTYTDIVMGAERDVPLITALEREGDTPLRRLERSLLAFNALNLAAPIILLSAAAGYALPDRPLEAGLALAGLLLFLAWGLHTYKSHERRGLAGVVLSLYTCLLVKRLAAPAVEAARGEDRELLRWACLQLRGNILCDEVLAELRREA